MTSKRTQRLPKQIGRLPISVNSKPTTHIATHQPTYMSNWSSSAVKNYSLCSIQNAILNIFIRAFKKANLIRSHKSMSKHYKSFKNYKIIHLRAPMQANKMQ